MTSASELSFATLLAAIAAFFTLSIIVGIALAFPDWGIAAIAAIKRRLGIAAGKVLDANRSLKTSSNELCVRGNAHTRHWLGIAKRSRLLIGIATIAMLTPVVLAFSFQQYAATDYFDDTAHPADPVVLALLQGEQLIPPAPLPPEVFVTPEVEKFRPALGGANRDWNLLDPEFRKRLLVVFEAMRRHGYEVALIEGHRSAERQDYLSSLGKHVTNASAYQSYHQFGLASDCAFYLADRIVIDERDPWTMQGYRLLGETAESVGLTWGGRWKMMDFGHLELRRAGVGVVARGR
jgi:peptidoglycan L-alanyl-D-glutamate endopeptidase CwlK